MQKSLSLSCLIFFLALPCLAVAQSAQQQQLFRMAEEALLAAPANYLAPLDSLRKSKPGANDAPGTDAYQHVMSVYQTFVSNYDSALYYFDQQALAKPHAPQDFGIDSGFVKESPFRHGLTALPEKISQHQVVMLNETSFMPAHRAFTISLLDELYKQGFRHLALETIAASDTALLNQRKYPIHESGYYQKEPLYGELVRQALKKGFKLLAYQSESTCPANEKDAANCNNFRDSVQAQNLTRWVAQNPNKKLFVYTGPSQIFEQSRGKWIRMATYFKRLSGIDPFTINQAYLNEHTNPALEDPRYRAAADLKNIQAPMVAYAEDTLWSHSKQVNATVFHPRYLNKTSSLPHYQFRHQRPSFYMLHNKRRPILITKDTKRNRFSNELLPANARLIQVFYQKEKGRRVPADVVELKKDQEEAILYLYPGAYEIIYLNKDGKALLTRPFTIN